MEAYTSSVTNGDPMSGRELCRTYGVNPNNKDWRQLVIRSGKERLAANAQRPVLTPGTLTLEQHVGSPPTRMAGT